MSRPRPRVLLAVVLPLLVMLTGCLDDEAPVSRESQPSLDLADVEELSLLEFPESAALGSTTYQSFTDWHLTAMVTMPAEDVDGFVADNELPAEPGERAVRNSDRPDDPAWDPDAATTVVGYDGGSEPDDGVYRRLMIDTGSGSDVTVYLVAFTT